MEWIKCKDKLPEKLVDVLTYDVGVCRVGHVIAKQDEGMTTKFRSMDSNSTFYPTHWMPLPEPPKTN